MNKAEILAQSAVMKALGEGRSIETCPRNLVGTGLECWVGVSDPAFNFSINAYRVQPSDLYFTAYGDDAEALSTLNNCRLRSVHFGGVYPSLASARNRVQSGGTIFRIQEVAHGWS